MNNSVGSTARLIGAGLRALLVLTVICGVLYPLAITGVAQALFNDKANGSEVKSEGKVVGSSLIGQTYNLPKKNADDAEEAAVPDLKWFQPRPSNGLGSNSVNPQYSLLLSGATNRSGDNGVGKDGRCPTDPKDAKEGTLCKWVVEAQDAVIHDNSTATYKVKPSDVPADAVTSSGSGLDPDISPAYAKIQVHRVAEKNNLDVKQVEKLVQEHTEGRTLGFIGEPRVNVLELNIALKELIAKG
ncbi:potassium-transporting ATPase subunit C [Streptomyces lunaelactis]|uniref:potassium-transporting ATPase subunit C n=1 Tax=Streptomyces lunaelactis TaxID=1535768 RepID=UPI001584765C|nr:potassium-transporting ATPase subunit C [Streptomyces lunaelactis]NUK00050.1 potassium-transporting ATPase subunit C [Streptomyces lunaelactis]NUK18716.1 potassium-transporting ATPase subunit C [Streptomyces lunaelactis]NUK37545.1 potassium-transporting ATPase subunit C [Streptomyces lunaelactis]NUK39523.1 potassium-transporting ATPase subunit C [Streptomyces lunaelactis]NUK90474.1 potassium-transporting ATPase subunit C [Streptomyces lunaelactis]